MFNFIYFFFVLSDISENILCFVHPLHLFAKNKLYSRLGLSSLCQQLHPHLGHENAAHMLMHKQK